MKFLRYGALLMLLSVIFSLYGCKAVIDRQNATEPPPRPVATDSEASIGYDTRTPKDAHWFDNAVFVGDSVTLKLSYYCASNEDALGSAEFFCAGSLGYTNALWDIDDSSAVHPYYKGETHLTEECAEQTGKENVFIMLGMNDIGLYGTDGALESCKTLISNILERTPYVNIYLQTVTPMIEKAQGDTFNNELVREFNAKLKTYCEDSGYKYLDVYSVMADEDGNLPLSYCSDPDSMGLHFTDSACKMWSEYLKNNA